MRGTLNKIIPNYESKNRQQGEGDVRRRPDHPGFWSPRAKSGDVTLVIPPYWAALASGNIDRSTITTVASCLVAVVVPHGAPKPDISSAAQAVEESHPHGENDRLLGS